MIIETEGLLVCGGDLKQSNFDLSSKKTRYEAPI